MKYDNNAIARELDHTALGYAYYGNALYVACDFPLSDEHMATLHRWLDGEQTTNDVQTLQDIAIVIRGLA